MSRQRNGYELKLIKKSGQITAHALKKVLESVKPGVNLLELEKIAAGEIQGQGGGLSFPTVAGYRWATCMTVNDELVHGIPRDYTLRPGDLLSVDVGAVYKGWHTDAAWSVIVGEDPDPGCQSKKREFLAVGEEALWKAVKRAKAGARIGDISNQIESTVVGAGFSVSDTLVGHGVGRSLHEPPNVPGVGSVGTGPLLLPDTTIAIEVIYAQRDARARLASDGWTYVTRDGSWGGLFEMSLVVRDGDAEVLTDWRKI